MNEGGRNDYGTTRRSSISLAATSVSGPADVDAADQECSRQPARDPTIHRTGATTHFQVFGPDRRENIQDVAKPDKTNIWTQRRLIKTFILIRLLAQHS